MATQKAARSVTSKTPPQKRAVALLGTTKRSVRDGGADGTSAKRVVEHPRSGRIDVGDKLPDASLEDQDGKPFRLSSLRGRPAVIYFYPKDDTPGCTREACAFQAQLPSFAKLGAQVIGVSPDPATRHAKFAEKYHLRFPLLVDAERNFARACAVLVPKTLYGKTSIGIERSTFLLDARGIIRRVWRRVKVDGHADQVIEALRELRNA